MVTALLMLFFVTVQLSSAKDYAATNRYLFLFATVQLSSAKDYTPMFTPEQLEARSLKRFTRSHADNANCWNRSVEMDGFISPVDTHNHFRPFGGPPVPFSMYLEWMREHGILFTTMFGIGQQIINKDKNAKKCCYYGHCPTPEYRIVPDPLNDIRNAQDYQRYQRNDTQKDMIHLTLSATFPNLQAPEDIINILDEQLENKFPGAFTWAGEINVFKHALAPNGVFDQWERLTVSKIKSGGLDAFFKRMSENKSPVTLHCDLGCDVKIKLAKTQWTLQANGQKKTHKDCAPPNEQLRSIQNPENVKFWKKILTRGDSNHYNKFFSTFGEPKPNFRKIQHLQVWDAILSRYPSNTIVWAHIGLSLELRTLQPKVHSDIMANLFDSYPNLHADVSWDILAKVLLMNYDTRDPMPYMQTPTTKLWTKLYDNEWLQHKDHILRTGTKDDTCQNGLCGPTHAMAVYLSIFEKYSDRFLTGTDYVASYGTKETYPGQKACPTCPSGCVKDNANHAQQVTDTSSINIFLSDKAFRKIVLGENFFRITGLDSTYAPPAVCGATDGLNVGLIVGLLGGLVVLLVALLGLYYLRKKQLSGPAVQTVTSGAHDTKQKATTGL